MFSLFKTSNDLEIKKVKLNYIKTEEMKIEAKNKADELVKKMHDCGGYGFEISDAVECAIIAVDEILNIAVDEILNLEDNQLIDKWFIRVSNEYIFWNEVKTELIEML